MDRETRRVSISIDTKTMLKGVGIIIATFLFLNALKILVRPLTLISIAFFLALALNPAVELFTNKLQIKSRVKSTALTFIVFVFIIISFLSAMLPSLVSQTISFVQDVPATIQNYKTQDTSVSRFIERYKLQDDIDNMTNEFSHRFSDISKPTLSAANTVGSTVVSTLAVFVMTFMMLIEGPKWLGRFWQIQPKNKREERKAIAQRLYRTVTGYVTGQVSVAVVGAIFAFFALIITSQIFHASVNAVALALIIALFALLPLIGTTLGASIVVLFTLFVSVPMAITMAIFFVVYQQIENITIQPYIQSKTNDLTPLIVFVAALLGVSIGGILGALFAIPIAGCIKVLVESYFSKKSASNIK